MCLEEEQSGYRTEGRKGLKCSGWDWRRGGRAGALGQGRGMNWEAVGGKDFGVGIVGFKINTHPGVPWSPLPPDP